jgi:kinesin family protein 18/19
VRIRPFSAKEATQLAPQDNYQPFLGDGGLSAGSPLRTGSLLGVSNAPSLRTKFLRPIISPVDDKVLIFDPPDTNPLTRLYNTASQNTFGHGSKKAKDVRYAFDRVFDDKCSQEMVFENTTKPLLDGILNGYNASVFAYGVGRILLPSRLSMI